jgi:peptidyl-prolyl cis-trans isomerase A (cyclophilin A)
MIVEADGHASRSPGTRPSQEDSDCTMIKSSLDNYIEPMNLQVYRRWARRLSRCGAVLGIVALTAATVSSCASGQAVNRSALLDLRNSAEPAPEVFRVRFETSRGVFVMEAHRAWSPWGVDRFYYLVRRGFYDGTRFYRVLDGFIAQFGISGDPKISAAWTQRIMPDDTVKHQSNLRGRISFASFGPHTRTTQLFINDHDNANLDRDYAPIGEVVKGMNVVDSLWKGYGDVPPAGAGPQPPRIFAEGEAYLAKEFPKLDYIKTARVVR